MNLLLATTTPPGVLQGEMKPGTQSIVSLTAEDQTCDITKCQRWEFSTVQPRVPLTENRIRQFPEVLPWGPAQLLFLCLNTLSLEACPTLSPSISTEYLGTQRV